MPPSSIAHFEIRLAQAVLRYAPPLANALEVTTDYLLGRVDDPGLAQAGDPLFRDIGKLTGNDREIAKDFLKMLAERNEAREMTMTSLLLASRWRNSAARPSFSKRDHRPAGRSVRNRPNAATSWCRRSQTRRVRRIRDAAAARRTPSASSMRRTFLSEGFQRFSVATSWATIF